MAEFGSAVVALASAALSTASAINHVIHTVKDANRDYVKFSDEVSQFRATVTTLEQHLSGTRSLPMNSTPYSQLNEQIISQCDKARDVLVRIDRLNKKILGSSSLNEKISRPLRKRAWLQHVSSFNKLIEELRNVRLMLSTT